MTSLQSRIQQPKPRSELSHRHPLCRGDFAAVVFSGRTSDLGELPGEPTAHAIYKFVMDDPRLNAREDFARSAGSSLPKWPAHRVQPTDGVCFVFTDAGHPAAQPLMEAGACVDQHLVILNEASQDEVSSGMSPRLARFVEGLPSRGKIVLLGYGHQGGEIARTLCDLHRVEHGRILVCEASIDSQRQASADGLELIEPGRILREAAAVIYSPLMRHQRLHAILEQAERAGLPVLDNSQQSSGLRQFVRQGNIWLDAAADGALLVSAGTIRRKNHGLALSGQVIREDRRRVAGVEFPNLHAGQSFTFLNDQDAVDVSAPSPFDALCPCTLASSPRAYISLRHRADHGFFAARELCERMWPQATREVFPSEHVIDLGATSFERLLQGHLVGREVACTMQTPAQRATLGIVAGHYAANRPIIEIGSAFGGSALLMAAATEQDRPPLYSIDPETSTRDIMRFAFEREGHLDRLSQVIKTSDDAIGELQALRDKAGLVFIDGLHTERGVMSDFENYLPLVAPGGALLFHDVCPQIHSVMRVVFERVLTDPRFEIKCLVDGLAVFERKP